jgi:hypothetical protein
MEYTIPIGTILYSGGFSSLPNDPTHYHFFTKNKDIAKQFASISKTKTMLTFEVISPIRIHLQEIPSSLYYFDTPEDYASEEAQSLCRNGYSGYASKDDKYEIEDIGLCNSKSFLKQIKNTGSSRKKKYLTRRRKTNLFKSGK